MAERSAPKTASALRRAARAASARRGGRAREEERRRLDVHDSLAFGVAEQLDDEREGHRRSARRRGASSSIAAVGEAGGVASPSAPAAMRAAASSQALHEAELQLGVRRVDAHHHPAQEVVRQPRRAAAPAQPRRREAVERRGARIAGERVVLGVARREAIGARLALEQPAQPPRVVGRHARLHVRLRRRRREQRRCAPARRAAASNRPRRATRRRFSPPRAAATARAAARGRARGTPAAVRPQLGAQAQRRVTPRRHRVGAGPLGGEAEVRQQHRRHEMVGGVRGKQPRLLPQQQLAQIVAEPQRGRRDVGRLDAPQQRERQTLGARRAVRRQLRQQPDELGLGGRRDLRPVDVGHVVRRRRRRGKAVASERGKVACRARGLGEHAVDERLGLLRRGGVAPPPRARAARAAARRQDCGRAGWRGAKSGV